MEKQFDFTCALDAMRSVKEEQETNPPGTKSFTHVTPQDTRSPEQKAVDAERLKGGHESADSLLSDLKKELLSVVKGILERAKNLPTYKDRWQFRGPGFMKLLKDVLHEVEDEVLSTRTTSTEERAESDKVRAEVDRMKGKNKARDAADVEQVDKGYIKQSQKKTQSATGLGGKGAV